MNMCTLDKLRKITLDEDGKVSNLINSKDKNKSIIIEKFHSITQWFSIFEKSYYNYRVCAIEKKSLDEQIIELSKYLTICNGILDTYKGLYLLACGLLNYKDTTPKDSFSKMRMNNKEHDDYFGITSFDDDNYFKHVRAIYGQHPTNLKYPELRAFSSWPFKSKEPVTTNESDLYTNIYFDESENPLGYKFYFYYCDIEDYISKLLKRIENLVNKIYEEIYGL